VLSAEVADGRRLGLDNAFPWELYSSAIIGAICGQILLYSIARLVVVQDLNVAEAVAQFLEEKLSAISF